MTSIPTLNTRALKALSCVALAALQLSGATAMAAPADNEGAKVLVNAVRGPELKSYRFMSAGLDAFDEHHALAPKAPHVRFRLRPLSTKPSLDMRDLALRLAGNTISVALPIAADNTFLLARHDIAFAEDADLVLNKKRGDYRWDAMVNTPDVPEGMRRVGDLRLECQVVVAVAKKNMNLMERAFAATVFGGTDWCKSPRMEMGTRTTRKVASATLVSGERRVALKLSDDGFGYSTPPESEGFPNDALVEVKYTDDEAVTK